MAPIFRQYFDTKSSTYTYLLGDLKRKTAALIDTVLEHVDRDLTTIEEFDFEKIYLVSTHVHADHVTGNGALKEKLNKCHEATISDEKPRPRETHSVLSKYYENARADIKIGEGDELSVGSIKLRFLHTPGHTLGCLSIVDDQFKRVFTGDTLLIRGCGRTDFQGGSSGQLYDSVREKLFKLDDEYLVYPAHDYKGRTASSIGEEKRLNPRLTKTKNEFEQIMANLNLAFPKMIDVAVPANLNCGYEASPSTGDNSK